MEYRKLGGSIAIGGIESSPLGQKTRALVGLTAY